MDDADDRLRAAENQLERGAEESILGGTRSLPPSGDRLPLQPPPSRDWPGVQSPSADLNPSYSPSENISSSEAQEPPPLLNISPYSPAVPAEGDVEVPGGPSSVGSSGSAGKAVPGAGGKRGRPRKHEPKIPLPPLYVFIRNMLHNTSYNPKIISWVNETAGVFKVNNTAEFARTWGRMKSNRSEQMNYEKMSRAMRYHYGNEKQGRKGHLGMVKEKRLVYRFGELAINWRTSEVKLQECPLHDLCKGCLCLWTKE